MKKRVLSLLIAAALVIASLGVMGAAAAEGEQPTVKLLAQAQSFDMNEDIVAKMLYEATGLSVEYSNWNDEKALVLEISSGTEYDAVMLTANLFQQMKNAKALKDISGLLENHQDIKDAISEKGWYYVTEDGAVYGIPNVDDAVYTGGLGYREDIFAENDISADVETIDDFYNLLVEIKDKTGLIPLTGSSAVEAVIASGFGLSYDFVVDEETDEIKSWLRNPGMKEYLVWMNKVYNEGLIDIDWPVNNGDTINNKMSTGAAVMTYAAHWSPLNWVNALRESGDEDAYFDQIVPLADANGKRHIAVSNGVSNVWCVPATASDERTEYFLNVVASRLQEDVYWMFNDGYEGTHYYFDENHYPIPIQPIFNDDMKNGDKYQIGRNQYVHPFSWMARVHKTQVQWDAFYDANSKAAYYGFEGKPLTFASFPEYAEYYGALNTLCNDYFKQVIAGTESIDSYDDFVAEWEASGGVELEAAATEWYHANPGLVEMARESYSPYNSIFGYEIN